MIPVENGDDGESAVVSEWKSELETRRERWVLLVSKYLRRKLGKKKTPKLKANPFFMKIRVSFFVFFFFVFES